MGVDAILYDYHYSCTCHIGFSGDNCQLSDALPQLQVVVNDTLQGQSENRTVNGVNYAGRNRTLWATQQDYNLARVNLVSANMSNGTRVNSSGIQFVLANGPPGFFIDENTGELLGKSSQPHNTTTSTLYATYEGTAKYKLWDLNFEFKAADTASDANGPNGYGCSGNGYQNDQVEFDQRFTCACDTGVTGENCQLQWQLIGPLAAITAVVLVLVIVWRVQVSQLKHPRASGKFVTLNTVYESQRYSVDETLVAVDDPVAQTDNGMQQSENYRQHSIV